MMMMMGTLMIFKTTCYINHLVYCFPFRIWMVFQSTSHKSDYQLLFFRRWFVQRQVNLCFTLSRNIKCVDVKNVTVMAFSFKLFQRNWRVFSQLPSAVNPRRGVFWNINGVYNNSNAVDFERSCYIDVGYFNSFCSNKPVINLIILKNRKRLAFTYQERIRNEIYYKI